VDSLITLDLMVIMYALISLSGKQTCT